MKVLRDLGHLLRFAGIFLAGALLFVGLRSWLVPKSFGQYGHYRGDAISEIAAKPIRFSWIWANDHIGSGESSARLCGIALRAPF